MITVTVQETPDSEFVDLRLDDETAFSLYWEVVESRSAVYVDAYDEEGTLLARKVMA